MCFSAAASFVAGATLTTAGVITVQKKTKKEIPLALIPLLFGLQQITEGLVWISLTKNIIWLQKIVTQIYVLFSHVLWPIFVPIAIGLVEPVGWRKKAISICAVLGAVVGLYNFWIVTQFPVSSEIAHHSINYIFSVSSPASVMYVYIIATCGSCLLSSHRLLKVLGILSFVFLLIAYYFYIVTLASVWCFFAAILSFIIYWFFKQKNN
jgi:hypothetical protein